MSRTEDLNSYLGFNTKLTRIENIRDNGPYYLIDAEDIDWSGTGMPGTKSQIFNTIEEAENYINSIIGSDNDITAYIGTTVIVKDESGAMEEYWVKEDSSTDNGWILESKLHPAPTFLLQTSIISLDENHDAYITVFFRSSYQDANNNYGSCEISSSNLTSFGVMTYQFNNIGTIKIKVMSNVTTVPDGLYKFKIYNIKDGQNNILKNKTYDFSLIIGGTVLETDFDDAIKRTPPIDDLSFKVTKLKLINNNNYAALYYCIDNEITKDNLKLIANEPSDYWSDAYNASINLTNINSGVHHINIIAFDSGTDGNINYDDAINLDEYRGTITSIYKTFYKFENNTDYYAKLNVKSTYSEDYTSLIDFDFYTSDIKDASDNIQNYSYQIYANDDIILSSNSCYVNQKNTNIVLSLLSSYKQLTLDILNASNSVVCTDTVNIVVNPSEKDQYVKNNLSAAFDVNNIITDIDQETNNENYDDWKGRDASGYKTKNTILRLHNFINIKTPYLVGDNNENTPDDSGKVTYGKNILPPPGLINYVGANQNNEYTSYINFFGNTYGEFIFNSDSYNIFTKQSYSIDLVYRTKTVGDDNTAVLSTNSKELNGIFVKTNNLVINNNDNIALLPDKWTHLVIVVDLTNDLIDDNEEESNRRPLHNISIYINGVLCSCSEFNGSLECGNNYFINKVINAFNDTYTGQCDIARILLYNKAISATDVLQNYKSSLPRTQKEEFTNRDIKLPTIDFYELKFDGGSEKTFTDVNTLTLKANQKTTYVNCKITMRYLTGSNDNNVHVYFGDVLTQGTSTLMYPIKNYKIKLYCPFFNFTLSDNNTYLVNATSIEDSNLIHTGKYSVSDTEYHHDGSAPNDITCTIPANYSVTDSELTGTIDLQTTFLGKVKETNVDGTVKKREKVKKHKIILPGKSQGEMGRGYWHKESTFTLKCDFMEAAHLNNTPTCDLFDKLVRDTIDAGDGEQRKSAQSPAIQNGYRDAIDGVPCVVYYHALNNAQTGWEAGVLVGTYMFNIDKSGDSLGFEVQSYSDDPNVEDWSWHQSYEGKANSSYSAGAFYRLDEFLRFGYGDYQNRVKQIIAQEGTEFDIDDTTNMDNPDKKYTTNPSSYYYDSNYEQSDKGIYLSEESWKRTFANYDINDPAAEKKYITNDFEIRYDWLEREKDPYELDGEYIDANDSSKGTYPNIYGYRERENEDFPDGIGLIRMFDFISNIDVDNSDLNPESTTKYEYNGDSYKNYAAYLKTKFPNYFSIEYLTLYYLQMIVFGQVDNAGKNCMWDTWDGKIWYPRPYDQDTMAGLDNFGYERITPDAELFQDLSPAHTATNISVQPDQSEIKDRRYTYYSSGRSKLWRTFAKIYDKEIKNKYKEMRDSSKYDINYIMDHVKSKTTNIIGEKYYNRDMYYKFIKESTDDNGSLIASSEMYRMIHGNRLYKYESWLKQRIIFCDTLFEYIKQPTGNTNSTNTEIKFSINAIGNTNLIIKTYSPQYTRLTFNTNEHVITYCSPYAQYNNGTLDYGTLFTINSHLNAETTITGASNIKEIIGFETAKIMPISMGYAEKLLKVVFQYANIQYFTGLSQMKLLSYLELVNCSELNTLDISKNVNLKTLKLYNNTLSTIKFPENARLETIDISEAGLPTSEVRGIQKVELKNLYSLTNLNLIDCEKLTSISIQNCAIQQINYDKLTQLYSVTISDCPILEEISLTNMAMLSTINIRNCPKLKKLDLSKNTKLTSLDLSSGVPNLEILIIEQNTNLNNVKFDYTCTSLKELDAYECRKLQTVGSGADPVSKTIDLSQFTLNNACFSSVGYNNDKWTDDRVNKININYEGPCYNTFNHQKGIFENCIAIEIHFGTLKCIGESGGLASAQNMFRNACRLLSITYDTVNFSKCTSLAYAFQQTTLLPYNCTYSIIESAGENLASISYLFESNASKFETGTSINVSTISVELPDEDISGYSEQQSKYLTAISQTITFEKNHNNTNVTYASSNYTTISKQHLFKNLTGLKTCVYVFGSNFTLGALHFDKIFSADKYPSLTNFDHCFYGCSNLKKIVSSDSEMLDLSKFTILQSVRNMFCGTISLDFDAGTKLKFKKDDKPCPIYQFGHMFSNSSVTLNMNESFNNDSNNIFKQISNNANLILCGMFMMRNYVPNAYWAAGNQTKHNTFTKENCNVTGTVNLENFSHLKNMRIFDNVFMGTRITEVTGTLFSSSNDSLKSISGLFADTNITTFDLNSFIYCIGLKSIGRKNTHTADTNDIYNYDLSVNHSAYDSETFVTPGLFENCRSLVSITGTFNSINLENISNLFCNCTSLQTVVYKNFNTLPHLTNISYCYYGCESLSNDIIADDNIFYRDTETGINNTIENISYAFANTKNVIPIIDNFFVNLQKLENADGVFANCKGFTTQTYTTIIENDGISQQETVTIEKDISYLKFTGCSSLRTLRAAFSCTPDIIDRYTSTNLNQIVKEKESNYSNSIARNTYLKNTWNTLTGNIPYNLFNDCLNLTHTDAMFYGCTDLNGFEQNMDSEDPREYSNQQLFSQCVYLESTASMFQGCINLHGNVPPLWKNSRNLLYNKLTNVSAMFMRTAINIYNISNIFDYTPNIVNMAYIFSRIRLWNGNSLSTALNNSEYAIGLACNFPTIPTQIYSDISDSDWTAYSGQVNDPGIFTLNNLSNVSQMFLGTPIYNVTNIFNSCPNIINANGTFAFTKLERTYSNIFDGDNSKQNSKLSSVKALFTGCSQMKPTDSTIVALQTQKNYPSLDMNARKGMTAGINGSSSYGTDVHPMISNSSSAYYMLQAYKFDVMFE